MDEEKNSGVTESRFALTLLICLLFAVGYVALLRLAGPKETAGDTAPDGVPVPYAGPGPAPPAEAEPQPRVLPLEKPEDGHRGAASIAKRPWSGQETTDPERR